MCKPRTGDCLRGKSVRLPTRRAMACFHSETRLPSRPAGQVDIVDEHTFGSGQLNPTAHSFGHPQDPQVERSKWAIFSASAEPFA